MSALTPRPLLDSAARVAGSCVLVLELLMAGCSTPAPTVREAPDSDGFVIGSPDGGAGPVDAETAPPDVPAILDVPDGGGGEDPGVAVLDAEADTAPDVPAVGPDAGPVVGDGTVGTPCFLDKHCNDDGLCLDWPGGYCTQLNCPTVAQCPQGSACVDLSGGTTVCLEECDPLASSCREQYGCKPFVDVGGAVHAGCVGLSPDAVPAGGACKAHGDCAGSLACLGFVPGGYCALVGCGQGDCPDGTACVTYNGHPTCLASCQIDADCMVGGATLRRCGPLLDTDLAVAQVCIPSVEDAASVGEGCATDLDCDSNECRIVADGKCVGQSLGCFVDGDCPGAGVCEKAPAYVKGMCTQACASDVACPNNSLCVATTSGLSWCQVPCKGPIDLLACDPSLGEACIFGDPVVDTTGGGKFACAVVKPGDPGMTCESDADCKTPGCLGTEGAPGTCAPACDASLSCPFPATCVMYQDAARCMRRCFSVNDCPGTMSCKTTPTSFTKICVP